MLLVILLALGAKSICFVFIYLIANNGEVHAIQEDWVGHNYLECRDTIT